VQHIVAGHDRRGCFTKSIGRAHVGQGLYVDDVVDAFLAAAVAPRADGASVDIGSGKLVSVRALVAQLKRLVGGPVEPRFGALPDRMLERVRVADPATAAAVIGWRPRTSLEDGLAQTVEFYRDQLSRAPVT
jgi:nucleoside-diphosphate-sugar epimerase